MVGKAYISTFPFYDRIKNKMSFKNRPVLIIGQADKTDYIVLPISRVTMRENLDEYYDVKLSCEAVPLMNLKQESFIRTNKQTVVNISSLTKEITDFKSEYPEIFLEVISKVEKFQNNLIKNAL